MPELPEVETVKNVLSPIVINRTILSVDILRNCTVKTDENDFKCSLKGQKFLSISRIGKFLIFHLTNDFVIVSHLRMEGKFFEVDENDKNTKYARVVFHLNNNKKICYDDSRCFGIMILSNEKEYMKLKDLAKLGPEPFVIDDYQYFINRCKKNNSPIKSTLLDQSLMTGLGNIYADEVLYASKIHPLTPSNKITLNEWENLVLNARKILMSAIKAGGSTIKSYHPGKDIDGMFQDELHAYGKKDQECSRCGAIMRFIKVGGRGTTFCPHCQVKKGQDIKVAIFGKIASGKSTVTNVFKDKGYPTISCDDIVHDLYKKQSVAQKVSSLAGIPYEKQLDYKLLREAINKDNKIKTKIEKYIYPMVMDEVEIFLNKNKGIRFVEVPRLFEAKVDNYFDVIIGVDIDSKEQEKRLKARNPETYKELMKLNSNNSFDENKRKADFIIDNSKSLNDMYLQIDNILKKLTSR